MSDAPGFGPDDFPRYEALAAQLATAGSWKDLERATRSMLRAMVGGASPDQEATLWRRLRWLYQERLADPKSALLAAEQLAKHDPMNVDDRLALARLYAAQGDAHKAGKTYEALIADDPTNLTTVRELVTSRLPKNPDWAWPAMSILAYAGALTASDRVFYDARKPSRLPTAQIDRNNWSSIEPPGANRALDLLFGSLAPATYEVAKKHPFPPARADLRFVPPTLSSPLFPAAFACAMKAFGLPPQMHFADPRLASEVGDLGPVVDDALRELLFIAGRQAAYHRPWHLLLFAFPSTRELTALFWAGRLIVRPDAEVPSTMRSFAAGLAIDLQAPMTEGAKYSLGVAFERLGATPIELRRWRDAQDLSAARFGLLLCGDLAIAKRVLDAERRPEDALSPDEVMKDLCGFAAQGMYAVFREELGLGAVTDEVPA